MQNLTKFLLIIIMAFCFQVERAHAGQVDSDNLLDWESEFAKGSKSYDGGKFDDCFSSGKVIWNASELNQTRIPNVISKDRNQAAHTLGWNIGRGIVYAAAFVVAIKTVNPILIGLLAIAIGIEVFIMFDVCTNAYVMAPYEVIRREGPKKWDDCEAVQEVDESCDAENEEECKVWKIKFKHPDIVTVHDVPFWYHCDPNWMPDLDKNGNPAGYRIDEGSEDAALIGHTWGYMGAASQYCVGKARQWANKDRIGMVTVEMFPWLKKLGMWLKNLKFSSKEIVKNRCKKKSRWRKNLYAGQKPKYQSGGVHVYAYYRFNRQLGKVQICVAAPYTLFPIRIGCNYIAPPGEENPIDPFLAAYVSGTRCAYLLKGREDLWALGKNMEARDTVGNDGTAVKKFLQSDLHISSTVVGCIKDMLIKVFVRSPSGVQIGEKPFFQVVQDRLRQIVFAVLVLYVSLVGIKIMMNPQPPQRAEFIMYIVKFALVVYFALGDAWYEVKNDEVTGLYPQLMEVSEELAGLFMEAQNENDPIGFCRYMLDGKNILGQRDIALGTFENLVPTVGYEQVKMTVWDLVDCKIINYLNLGSCEYSLAGLVGVWIVSAALLVSGTGILLSIVSFIYVFMVLLIIFRFTHIFILAMFTITILIFLSPIFLCFALFEVTKNIFQKWFTMLLGYMLYPALLFAFVALMLATFDSVFYGDIDQDSIRRGKGIEEACDNVDSMYCNTMDIAGYNNLCDKTIGYLADRMTTSLNLGPLGKFTILKKEYTESNLKHMVKLMLFAFLFYLFLGSISNFLAILVGVQDVGGMARGSINAMNIASTIGGGVMAAAGKAGGAAKRAATGGGKKGEGEQRRT